METLKGDDNQFHDKRVDIFEPPSGTINSKINLQLTTYQKPSHWVENLQVEIYKEKSQVEQIQFEFYIC